MLTVAEIQYLAPSAPIKTKLAIFICSIILQLTFVETECTRWASQVVPGQTFYRWPVKRTLQLPQKYLRWLLRILTLVFGKSLCTSVCCGTLKFNSAKYSGSESTNASWTVSLFNQPRCTLKPIRSVSISIKQLLQRFRFPPMNKLRSAGTHYCIA